MARDSIKLPLITDPLDTFQREARNALGNLEKRTAELEDAPASEGTTYAVFTDVVDGLVPAPGAPGSTAFLREDGAWVVPTSGVSSGRLINTTAPITGGGDLSADRTLAITSFSGTVPGAVPTSAGGTTNYLRADGSWAAPPGGGMSVGGTVTSGTAGSLLFVGAGPVLSQDNANLFWDDANNRLSIGTTSPGTDVEVYGADAEVMVHYAGNSRGGLRAMATQRVAFATTASGDDLVFGWESGHKGAFTEILRVDNGDGKIQFGNSSGAAVSAASTCALRFNSVLQSSFNGGSYYNVPQLEAALTTGSIPFANASGRLAQDNARLFWDASTNRLGVNTSSPQDAIHAKTYGSGGNCIRMENTAADGYTSLIFIDSAAAFQGGLYWANASAGYTPGLGMMFWYSSGVDIALGNGGGLAFRFGMAADSASVEVANGSSAAVSAANKGRLRYNTTGQKFQASANAGSYYDVPVLAAALTTGSIPFANASGQLAQDNAALFWDAANDRMGIGTTSPAATLDARGTGDILSMTNTSSSGYCGLTVWNSSNAHQASFGYGNASVGLTHLQSMLYWYSSGPDITLANGSRQEHLFGMTGGSAFHQMADGASAAVSAASTARIRYNAGTDKLQVSKNGAAYVDII